MIMARLVLCHLQGKESFEQLWMLRYIDQQLVADSSRTRRELSWKPTPRKSITRRLVFLIENMKKNPELWRNWNEAMLHKGSDRPHLVLHDLLCDAMDADRDTVVQAIMAQLMARDAVVQSITTPSLEAEQPLNQSSCIRALQAMDRAVANSFIKLLCQLIVTVMRTRNRPDDAAVRPHHCLSAHDSGFDNGLVSRSLFVIGEFLIQRFRAQPKFLQLTPQADDYITMTIHMAVDQIEDHIELSRLQSPVLLEELKKMPPPEEQQPAGENCHPAGGFM